MTSKLTLSVSMTFILQREHSRQHCWIASAKRAEKLSKLRKGNFTVEKIACGASRRGRMGGRHATTSDSRQGLPHVLVCIQWLWFFHFVHFTEQEEDDEKVPFWVSLSHMPAKLRWRMRGASATHYRDRLKNGPQVAWFPRPGLLWPRERVSRNLKTIL